MIAVGRGGWQTTVADLALILFMVSVAALADRPEATASEAEIVNPLPAMGEPIAIYRPEAGMPLIGAWLAEQAPDPRQQLTIVARYPADGMLDASAAGLTLLEEAQAAGFRARMMLEPAAARDVVAVLSYDSAAGSEWHDDCLEPGKGGADAASERNGPCE